jgi:hypothetical protein
MRSVPWTLVLAISTFVSASTLGGALETRQPQKHESRADLEKFDLHISGEVSAGKIFEQDIGHGLLFRLAPPSNDANAGWLIEIVPKTESDGPIEFSSIATPPYHAYNERDIAAVYGRVASDVVALKDRTFFFVQSEEDEHRAEEVVNAALYPTSISDEERIRVAGEKTQIQVGKGEFRILKSHLNHGRSLNDAGTIEWLRFELNIEFSSGLTMADIIARVARQQ